MAMDQEVDMYIEQIRMLSERIRAPNLLIV